MQSKIKKAIFPIAGLGSRFLPATKTLAKEMLIVMDRPILEWAVIEASRSGIEEMIFVTSSKKNSIIEHFNRSLELENLLRKKKKKEVFKYGVIDFQNKKDNFYQIKNLIEKPHPSKAPSNLTVVGRYILNYKVFDLLEKQKKGHGNEIQLTDSLISLIEKPGLYGLEFDGNRYDCGNKLGFIEANVNFGLKDKNISKNLRNLLRKI